MPFQMAANVSEGRDILKAIENGDEHVPGKTRLSEYLCTELDEATSWAWKKFV